MYNTISSNSYQQHITMFYVFLMLISSAVFYCGAIQTEVKLKSQ